MFAAEIGWGGVAQAYALSFIQPFGILWFIYLLPVFFVVTKLTRDVPQVMVWFVAALLQIADVHTGSTIVDEFCSRFVYFYSGYALAPYVFGLAETIAGNQRDAIRFLATWAVFEAAAQVLVKNTPARFLFARPGWAKLPPPAPTPAPATA
jgi:uncharacterized membrane protein YcfT